MKIRDYSSQFTIFVYTTDVDLGVAIKVHLSQAGYDAYYFQDAKSLEDGLTQNTPHILIFQTAALSGSLNDFVTMVRTICDEIRFIPVASDQQFEVLAQYNNHGIIDVVSEDSSATENRVVWAVDRACERLYLTFQNEQLFADLCDIEEKMAQTKVNAESTLKQAQVEKAATLSVSTHIADYRSAKSKEDMIQKFLQHIPETPFVFFKFLPTLRSFIATHSLGFPAKQIQGVGVQLESDDLKDLSSQMTMGLLPPRFIAMLVNALHFSPPKALPLYAQNALEGVFIHSGNLSADRLTLVNEEFTLLSLSYSNFILEKKVDSLEVNDPLTDLYNSNFYKKSLQNEVSRAIRLKKAVSVIKLSVDDLVKIDRSKGETVRDELIKSVATVIKKTCRTNDIACRTALNEIAMILPHCTKKGATIRAERIRRMIEATSFLENGMKVSVALGISEFPSLCESAKNLDESSTKALFHITEKGGNKICVYKASEGFRPEYEVSSDENLELKN